MSLDIIDYNLKFLNPLGFKTYKPKIGLKALIPKASHVYRKII
jgi:hypothetical protein